MTPTTADEAPKTGVRPRHGYTKDGTPVYGTTRHFVKHDTVAQRINAAVGLGSRCSSAPCGAPTCSPGSH